jgi:hypothetical protein
MHFKTPSPSELEQHFDVSQLPDLIDRDYEDIDADLLGTVIIKRKHMPKNCDVAPPQGNTFLSLVQPLSSFFSLLSHRYR